MKQHILKYVTIICTLIILVVGVAASSARAERALSPELKLGLAPSLTPALAPEGRWGAEVGEVTADVPQELVNEEFDRWTLGGGFIYWATGCSIPSPDDGPTGGANAAESADDITAPQAVNNHYLLRRLPIVGARP